MTHSLGIWKGNTCYWKFQRHFLTHRNEVAIVFQHHIHVQSLLSRIQVLPLLPSKVNSHIFEWNWSLQWKGTVLRMGWLDIGTSFDPILCGTHMNTCNESLSFSLFCDLHCEGNENQSTSTCWQIHLITHSKNIYYEITLYPKTAFFSWHAKIENAISAHKKLKPQSM